MEIALADFNRDGGADIAMADHDTFDVYVVMGQGCRRDGTTARATATGVPHIHGLLACGLNHDGEPDLAFASSGEEELIALAQ